MTHGQSSGLPQKYVHRFPPPLGRQRPSATMGAPHEASEPPEPVQVPSPVVRKCATASQVVVR
jgi:hypothetical protein